MTQDEREKLLLRDLCGRLPYGVKLDNGASLRKIDTWTKIISGPGTDRHVSCVKPYLRPKSYIASLIDAKKFTLMTDQERCDWYDENHIDYRGLIPLGLAIEVTEENDPYKR